MYELDHTVVLAPVRDQDTPTPRSLTACLSGPAAVVAGVALTLGGIGSAIAIKGKVSMYGGVKAAMALEKDIHDVLTAWPAAKACLDAAVPELARLDAALSDTYTRISDLDAQVDRSLAGLGL